MVCTSELPLFFGCVCQRDTTRSPHSCIKLINGNEDLSFATDLWKCDVLLLLHLLHLIHCTNLIKRVASPTLVTARPPAGLRQPRPQGPRLHLLAPALHRPGGRQGGGAGREAPDLRGDGSDRAHAAGGAHLPHRHSSLRLPQASQCLRGGQPRRPAQETAWQWWIVSYCKIIDYL